MTERKTVFIAVPNMGTVRNTLALNFCHWITNPNYIVKIFDVPFKRPVTVARNYIVQEFLAAEEFEYLMMIDADQSTTPNVLDLVRYDKDVICPVSYMLKEDELIPLILEEAEGGYKVKQDIVQGALNEVDATGTGCMFIHRRVLETMPPPWFKYEFDEFGIHSEGNDFLFCKAARQFGFKVYVHLGYITSHFQTVDLTVVANMLNTVRSGK